MIAADQRLPVGEPMDDAVTERRARPHHAAAVLQELQVGIEGDPTQHHHHFHVRQRSKFAIKKAGAIPNLFRRRFVFRRSAAHRSGDIGVDKLESVFAANGLAFSNPFMATCVTLLMLSLIGMPPLAGFFAKVSMFMESLREPASGRLTLLWLVALGLMNSVVSAFYYVRVLKAMFLRDPIGRPFAPPSSAVSLTIVMATAVSLGFGIFPAPLVEVCTPAAVQMLSEGNQMGRLGVRRIEKPGPASVSKPMDISRMPTIGAVGGPFTGGPTPPPSPPAAKAKGQQQPAATKKSESTPPADNKKSQAKGAAGASK